MSLATNVQDLATRIATEFKSLRVVTGTLSSLTTTNKTSLVAAINEVKAGTGASGAAIDDATTAGSTTWSSSKTSSEISTNRAALKSEILGGAGAAYDTLQELKTLLDNADSADQTAIDALTTAVGNRVRFDAAQSLTSPQLVQARANIGAASSADVGDTTTNFVTTFEAGLV